MSTIRIGSRESRLAVIQAELVRDYIRAIPGMEAEIVTMKTTGDRILDRRLDQVGGKGLFVKELDIALREKRSDLSVHCLKDMPMEVPEDLPVLGYSDREDPRDVLVLPEGVAEWDRSLPVGCSSRRRMLQLQALYPDVTFLNVRGNVLTRLRKLDSGEYGALILAAAGLKRLDLEERISRYFEPEEMIPSAGQGILTLQGRQDADYGFLHGFCSENSRLCAEAERTFVRVLGGGCTTPMAAYAETDGDRMTLRGLYYSEEYGDYCTGSMTGETAHARKLGEQLAEQLRSRMEEKHGGRTVGEGEQR